MELGSRVTGARIFSLADISASFGRSPPLGSSLVAGDLANGATSCGELEEVSRFRRVG